MARDAIGMRLQLPARLPEAVDRVAAPYVVRSFATADADDVGRLAHAAFRGSVDDVGAPVEDEIAELRDTVTGKHGPLARGASLVAVTGDAIVAASIVTLWRRVPLLAFVVCAPEHRGLGLGGALVARSAEALADDDHSLLRLIVTRTNPAVGLYRRLGFVDEPRSEAPRA